ncbi:hypothetical protein K9L16_04085 [Candidatus Pacearchaeota archaeon]|nr:hypothetical protein [Candidatus Pacearchaeota archaeon]
MNSKKKIKDNIKRDEFGKCIVCGDTAITSSGDCFYCNWKGITGSGAFLREIIKKENERINIKNDSNK